MPTGVQSDDALPILLNESNESNVVAPITVPESATESFVDIMNENMFFSRTRIDQVPFPDLKKVEVAGDGNCFFSSIARIKGNSFTAEGVRRSAVERISCFKEQDLQQYTELISEVNTLGEEANYLQNMAADGTWADDLVTGATASYLVSKINVYTKNLENGEWSLNTYTPKNQSKVRRNPDLNLQLVDNHYEPLIADTLADVNHPVKMIYEYPMLPQSLYNRVKDIPAELLEQLFDADPDLESQSEPTLVNLIWKAKEKMNEATTQLNNLERVKQSNSQSDAGLDITPLLSIAQDAANIQYFQGFLIYTECNRVIGLAKKRLFSEIAQDNVTTEKTLKKKSNKGKQATTPKKKSNKGKPAMTPPTEVISIGKNDHILTPPITGKRPRKLVNYAEE
jgi:hypothetical protein